MSERERPAAVRDPVAVWSEDGGERTALWRSESGARPPRHVRVVDDRMTADAAYRLACEGTALLWRGDYHGARQLLSALGRRVDRKPPKAGGSPRESFHLQRQAQSRRARILGMLLVPLDAVPPEPDGPYGYTVPLRRAPDVREACAEAYGPAENAPEHSLVPLRELLGVIGAHEWRRKGVPVPALGGERVHPAYGVFAPVRGEYVDLVARAELPPGGLAFDIGTGTGVLGAVLVRRGMARVVATDQDARALACARENAQRLGVAPQLEIVGADLFPPGAERASLVVCNPPWLPAKPTSPLEHAVYDPGGRMLRGFLSGLAERLDPQGEGWLILSDLAEHLGLRTREELLRLIADAGLYVAGRDDIRPRHPRSADPSDPLHAARGAEVTSLWRLRGAGG
ncbi:N5-glutamine methyltransferase family protein [Streptomyces nanshensis]|uniref:N5-glutamine methyltransferase family protein n=1 Tax=Streptomyces nanshensis TaxID=518642 RepID=UPI001FD08870|nr:class I SAM-dependent methyltransferase [Streptomyces nanshensis]